MPLYRKTTFDDWVHEGPSATDEVFQKVAQAGLELHAYPDTWESRSGVTATSSVAREVRLNFDYLRLFQAYDQLDVMNSAGIEAICRRIVLCQKGGAAEP